MEEIVSPLAADDFEGSINLGKFKIRLESDIVTVPGSELSAIESSVTRS